MIARNAFRSLKIRRKGAVRRPFPVHLAPAGGSPEISWKSIDEFLLIKNSSALPADTQPGRSTRHVFISARARGRCDWQPNIPCTGWREGGERARKARSIATRGAVCVSARTCSAYELIVPPVARFFPSFLRLVSSPRCRWIQQRTTTTTARTVVVMGWRWWWRQRWQPLSLLPAMTFSATEHRDVLLGVPANRLPNDEVTSIHGRRACFRSTFVVFSFLNFVSRGVPPRS